MSFLAAAKAFFSFKGVSETALGIVEKLSGTDWTPSQQAQFILDYQNATKHQSPMRRLITAAVVLGIVIFSGAYGILGAIEHGYVFLSIDSSSISAAAASENLAKIKVQSIATFRNELVIILTELKEPFMIVLGFYFLSHIVKK
ncbi:MAG: hypothetical protein WBF67_05325 [Olleya sp.]